MKTAYSGNTTALVLALLGTACGTDSGPAAPTDNFDRRAMLAHLGEHLLVPVYTDFELAAAQLATDIDGLCTAIGTADEVTALDAARASFGAAMDRWQLAEAMLLGPAAMNERTLREQIYSWPLVSSCAVDQEVAALHSTGAVDVTTKLNNRRGLDAIDYLLFAPSLDHSCTSQTAPAGWNELDDTTRKQARCGYARAAAVDVEVRAGIITSAWTEGDSPFLEDLANAGLAGSSFASAQEAVNVVSDALFYLDSDVKTMKLAEPAGIAMNSCATVQEPCKAELESPLSLRSKDNVVRNIEGFSLLFHGNAPDGSEGLGFDDFLIELGATDLATTMSRDIVGASTAVVDISGPLETALDDDYDGVVAAYNATKEVTVSLKSQFLTVLALDLPDSAAGDND